MLLADGKKVAIAPQALAELVPQALAAGYYYPEAVGLELERQFAWYGQIYRMQPWVRTLVDKRANAVARLNIEVWDERDDKRSLDGSSPYATFMRKPCTYLDNHTFWMWVSSTIDIYGETYCAVQLGPNGRPTSLYPMHPSRVSIKREPDTGDYRYIFQAGAGAGDGLVQFTQDQVVPWRLFNPTRTERGLSRLESVRSTLMAEDSSRNAQSSMWRNGGRPGVVLSSEKKLGPEGRERLKRSYESLHSGSSAAGQALVLEDGVKATTMQLTAVELDYIKSRQLNREELCAAYDVAPPMVHILDRATFSNVSAQMRAFYRDTMAPHLEFIESVLDAYVGGFYYGRKVARFSVDEVTRGDYEHRAEAAARLVAVGGMTPNEARKLMGLNPMDDPKADQLYANSAIQPLGAPAEQIRLMGNVAGGMTPDNVNVVDPLTIAGLQAASDPGKKPGEDGLNVGHDGKIPLPGKPIQIRPVKSTPKHLRAVKGALGRGAEIRAVARQLAERYPDDLEDIKLAVEWAISERDAS